MKKKIAVMMCAVLLILMICSAYVPVTSAGSAAITYAFSGSNESDAGFAQGTITVSAGASDGGTYYLYWADSSAVLEGFDPIGSVIVPSAGSASFNMPAYTAIPPKARKLAAFKSSSIPSDKRLSKAAAVYELPSDKILGKSDGDLLYSCASYSDFHICADKDGSSSSYPYDEQHLRYALKTAADRGVDFIVTTGDHVNNQRNDQNGGNNNFYAEEWNTYLKILAESEYDNPIYEAIGNHELWNCDTESDYEDKDAALGYSYFIRATGLNDVISDLKSGNAYYEMTEPVTGDHFLFMALEGGFYTDRVDEFSPEQLNWLESKLKQYQNDGKNIFVLEHANFEKWGSGDQLDKPIYDIPLKEHYNVTPKTVKTMGSTISLKNLLQTYTNAVFITGHTHFKFSLQLNYSNNVGSSMTMIHNSSVGAVRDILDRSTRVNDKSEQLCEGYIVEVYDNATIFYGTNLYYNSMIPTCSYIVPQSTSAIEKPTEPPTKPTEAAVKPTEPKPTEPPKSDFIPGDADGDNELSILDATEIQRHLAGIIHMSNAAIRRAMVNGEDELSILDATSIQRKLAGIIKAFVVEGGSMVAPTGAEVTLEEASSDPNVLRQQAKSALDKYWQLSSYDSYQALKKAYRRNVSYDDLKNAYNNFNTTVKGGWPGDTINIYFTDIPDWPSVNAYCYNSNTDKMAAWPGKACTYVGYNGLGQKVYRVSVPTGKYSYIIFSNGSSDGQTVDLALDTTKNRGYYTDGLYRGKYKCKTYVYGL